MKSGHRLASFAACLPAMLAGDDGPRRFLERCLEAVEVREPSVHAFSAIDVEAARRAADQSARRYRDGRPLSRIDGCVVGIKDIIETADLPTQMGSRIYDGWRPLRDSASVESLRDAGAVILGKTVTTEFAIDRPGPTRNPHDPERTPGGSSSGSAAAVGAGMLPVALGTQTQSSVLRPASYCGVYGFKPTLGLVQTTGIHPLSVSHDHVGILGGGLDDVWNTFRALAESPGNPGSISLPGTAGESRPRSLVVPGGKAWQEVDEETRLAFEKFVAWLKARGVEVVRTDAHPELASLITDLDAVIHESLDIIAFEMLWPFLSYRRRDSAALGPRIHGLLDRGLELGPERHRSMLERRDALRRRTARLTQRTDGFLWIASSGPAPAGLENLGSRTFPSYWTYLGFPSWSLPLLRVSSLPVGIQLMGFPRGDRLLAEQALWLANAFPNDGEP